MDIVHQAVTSAPPVGAPAPGSAVRVLRAAAALPVVVAALATPVAVSGQDTDSAPLAVPGLTVTAEDPLILLPPLGPPVSEVPLAVPAADRRPASYRGAPAVTGAGFGPPLAPGGVLRATRSVPVEKRRSVFSVTAGVLGMDAPEGVPATLSFHNGGTAPTAELGLSGLVPIVAGVAGDASARVALESNSWRLGLNGGLTFADEVWAGQAALSVAAGPLSGALSMDGWRARPSVQQVAQWRYTLAVELAVTSPAARPRMAVGVAGGRADEELFALPVVRLSYVGEPSWRLAAGVRPVLEYPSWLPRLIHGEQDSSDAIRPELGWLAWLGGGTGAVDLRVGWARGLLHGVGPEDRTTGAVGADVLLFGMALEPAWQTLGGGQFTVAARAGGNWDRHQVRWRLQAAGEWRLSTRLPITLLLGARWIGSDRYYGVYPHEDWALAIFRAEPGTAGMAGMGVTPVWGHRLTVVGGVNVLPAGDLTWGFGIEYARDIVRLTAPP